MQSASELLYPYNCTGKSTSTALGYHPNKFCTELFHRCSQLDCFRWRPRFSCRLLPLEWQIPSWRIVRGDFWQWSRPVNSAFQMRLTSPRGRSILLSFYCAQVTKERTEVGGIKKRPFSSSYSTHLQVLCLAAVYHIMALRLILDTLPKQVSRRWCNAAIIRTYSNEKPFKSLLSDHRVASPFADPARTRTRPLAADNLKYFSIAQEDPLKDKEDALKKAKSESPPNTTSKPVEEVKPETSKEQQEEAERLSAIEELRLLKEALEEEKKSVSGSDGPKGAGDEVSLSFMSLSELPQFPRGETPPFSSWQHTFDEDAEKEKRRKRLERNTRIGGIILFGSSVAGLVAFCLYYGRSKRDQAGNVIPDEFTGSFFAPFYRIAHSFRLWRDFVVEPAREQLLPDPLPHPYIQPRYTLVIEMKNVLVHPDWTYKTGYRFAKRPALEYFLDVVGYPNFEVNRCDLHERGYDDCSSGSRQF
ncbi:unnamed protein product [Cylicostephanus goldi]|uniref:Uncharacterized protein n=1 Tax=Cylicostephanus goldi TaxID=71465 RepID=A0A3P7M6E7_CYLGO|nr:unnamed protein product [Cylicostephanus goldi]